ncbi:hypothetical protein B0H21DRAFT_827285 [Amylocystis lapponica]|nr:hypothetical protein B0H21DRAFT_827285 [Amylocystis lapponica]
MGALGLHEYKEYVPPVRAQGAHYGSAPFANHNGMHRGSGGMFSPQTVDALANKMGLGARREDLHAFAVMSMPKMMLHIYALNLARMEVIEAVKLSLSNIKSRLTRHERLLEASWRPSDAQVALLKALIGHFLVKLLETYNRLPSRVASFVYAKAEWLHLGLYLTDLVIRVTVDGFLAAQTTEIKSNFCKQVMNSVSTAHMKSLDQFAIAMDIRASLALLRQIAGNRRASRNELNYWQQLEEELRELERKHGGNNHETAAWKEWEVSIIAKDNRNYGNADRAGNVLAVTAAELEAATSNAGATATLTVLGDAEPNFVGLGVNPLLARAANPPTFDPKSRWQTAILR